MSPRLAFPLHLGGLGGPQGRCSLRQGLDYQAQGGCSAPSVLRSGSAVCMRKLVGKVWGKGQGCRRIGRSFHGGLGSLTPGLSEARPSASPRIARFKAGSRISLVLSMPRPRPHMCPQNSLPFAPVGCLGSVHTPGHTACFRAAWPPRLSAPLC